jgi:non-heme chloroperoxidase
MKFIETKDGITGEVVKLCYDDVGTGATVVLIHGWPLSKEMWEYQVTELAGRGMRCITYDRRGFGASDKPWNSYGYNTLADDLKAILDELDLTDVTLVGFSMGGGEVARYFSRHGGARVSKAVLLSSVTPYMLKTDDNEQGVDHSVFDEMLVNIRNDRMAFLDSFGKQFYGVSLLNHPVSSAYLQRDMMLASVGTSRATQECAKAFATTDFRSDMAAINVPTLIIHGDADQTVPIEVSGNRSAQMVPDNTYIVYEGAPHGLFYTERERLNNDLETFILNK